MELLFIFVIIVSSFVIWQLLCRSWLDAPGMFMLHILLLMLPPAFLHLIGFSLSDWYFDIEHMQDSILLLAMLLLISLVGVFVGYASFIKYTPGLFLLPKYDGGTSLKVMFFGILVLTIISFVIVSVPLSMSGFNIFAAIELIRHDRFFSGWAILRQFQFFANFFSGTFLIVILKLQKEKRRNISNGFIWFALALFIFNLMQSLIMGGKMMVIFPLAFTIIAYQICVVRKGLFRLVIAGLLLANSIVAMQFVRSEFVQNADKPFFENVYVGMYYILYDSTLFYLHTDGELHTTSLGQDFRNGVAAAVPRAIWEDKPDESLTVGSRFKDQVTNFQGQGGWPIYGIAQWYVNFGWIGVFASGVLTGWFLSLLQKQYGDYRTNPFSLMILLHAIFSVMGPWPGGIHSFFIVHYILYIAPLFIFKFLTNRKLYSIEAR